MSIQDPSPGDDQLIRFPLAVSAPLWRRSVMPVAIGSLLAVMTLYAAFVNVLDGKYLVAVAVTMFFGPLVCLALGAAGSTRPDTGSMRLVNAEQGWRQVASVRPPRWVTIVGLVWLALGLVAAAVYGLGRLLGRFGPPHAQTSTTGAALAVVLALAMAAGVALVANTMITLRRAASDDGPSTIGVGLSPLGIHLDLPRRARTVRWGEITAISPELTTIGRAPTFTVSPFNRREQVPMVRISSTGSKVDLLIPLSQLIVSPDLMWTALTWYHHHSEARWELEQAESTTRLALWQQQAAQVSRP